MKFRKPQCVSVHQTSSSPSSPQSGLFFMPWNITASPTGISASITIAMSFVAMAIGKTSAKRRPTTYIDAYGASKNWSLNCS